MILILFNWLCFQMCYKNYIYIYICSLMKANKVGFNKYSTCVFKSISCMLLFYNHFLSLGFRFLKHKNRVQTIWYWLSPYICIENWFKNYIFYCNLHDWQLCGIYNGPINMKSITWKQHKKWHNKRRGESLSSTYVINSLLIEVNQMQQC